MPDVAVPAPVGQACKAAAATGERPLMISVGSWSPDEACTPDHPSPSLVNQRYFTSRVHDELLWVIYDLSDVPPRQQEDQRNCLQRSQLPPKTYASRCLPLEAA